MFTHLNKSLLNIHIFLHLTVSSHGHNKANSVPNSHGPSTMNSALQALHNSGFITEILSLVLTQIKPLGRGDAVGNSTDRHRLIWYCKSKEKVTPN